MTSSSTLLIRSSFPSSTFFCPCFSLFLVNHYHYLCFFFNFFGSFHPKISSSKSCSLFISFQTSTAFVFFISSLVHFFESLPFCPPDTFLILLPSLNFYFLLLAVLFSFSRFFLFSTPSFFPSLTPSQLWSFLSSPLIVMSPTF